MIWVVLILFGWLVWALVEPVWYLSRGTGQCRATKIEVNDPMVYRCKFQVGHNGRHHAEDGPIW